MSDDILYNFQFFSLYLIGGILVLKLALFATLKSRFKTLKDFVFFTPKHIMYSGSVFSRNMKRVQNFLSYSLLVLLVLFIVDRLFSFMR